MAQDFKTRQEYIRQLRFQRSKFRRISSLDLIPIPEHPSQENIDQNSDFENENNNKMNKKMIRRQSSSSSSSTSSTTSTYSSASTGSTLSQTLSVGFRKIIFFWPNLLVNLLAAILRYILYIPLSIAAPSFWLSALLWIFWKLLRIPLTLVKWLMNKDNTSSSSSLSSFSSSSSNSNGTTSPKRTILLSCGSTIQTLHLARNFYSSGARVIVFEFEGLFGLARFSTAVDKFYMVPRPTPYNIDNYIAALRHIVNKEKPTVYIPVCATSPAYYDSVAKPHLELLGCATFIPGLQETIILDDCLQFYQKCSDQNIPLPPHSVLSSKDDLWHLYDSGFISNFRNILMAVGMQGLLERYKYILPNSRHGFTLDHDISERQQWMIVRDVPGDHYVTCTTVKDSRLVSNVTCKVEHHTRNLLPMTGYENDPDSEQAQIEHWLKCFFAKVRFQRSINGHISFRIVKCQATGQILPLGVRLGVSLPYICYNRSHAQTLCRTMKCCVHKKPLNLLNIEEDSALSVFGNGWRWFAFEKTSARAALDKREALFAYWDPLPYCAYYHFQLPLQSVKMFLQKQKTHRTSTTTKKISSRITIPVH